MSNLNFCKFRKEGFNSYKNIHSPKSTDSFRVIHRKDFKVDRKPMFKTCVYVIVRPRYPFFIAYYYKKRLTNIKY